MTKTLQRKPIRKKVAKGSHGRSGAKAPITQSPVVYPREGMAKVKDVMAFLSVGRTKACELINDGVLEAVNVGIEKRVKWPSLWKFYNTGDGRLDPSGSE